MDIHGNHATANIIQEIMQLACVCERQWDGTWHSPSSGETVNSETVQPLLNSVSDTYVVFAKRHTKGIVTHVLSTSCQGALSSAVVGPEIWYIQFIYRLGSPENPGLMSHVEEGD